MVYLDHNASTPIDPEVFLAMEPYLRSRDLFGNPSSIHQLGQKAREGIEKSRQQVASLLGCNIEEVIFTSGGTEADNLAIKGTALAHSPFDFPFHKLGKKGIPHIITSQIEHEAVLNPCKRLGELGFRVTYLPVDCYGFVNPVEVEKAITEETFLITLMYVNNEVGTIQPLREIGKIAKNKRIPFHTDAVQAVGKIDTKVNEIQCDLLSLSAHKIYGPKGVGALFIRKGVELSPLLYGGPHEKSLRAGTENVPGIVGLGKACEIASKMMEEDGKRLKRLRNCFMEEFRKEGIEFIVNGDLDHSIPGTLNLSIPGLEGESMLQALDLEGICVSTGAACQSGSVDPSHVLMAMGVSREVAKGSIRISLGRDNKEEEIGPVSKIFLKIVDRLSSS